METIRIVLQDGRERSVSKHELQQLIVMRKIWFFERSDGWAVMGRDSMRRRLTTPSATDRRAHSVYAVVD